MKQFNHIPSSKFHIRELLYSSSAALALTVGPMWSVEAQDQPSRPQAQTKQQTQLRDTVDEGPDITIQQPPPTVTVKQPQPTVTVTQKPPRVTVKQPAPQIQVNMPEPQVTIKQPQPDVQIEMPKPQIRVQQAKPEVTFNQAPPDVQFQAAKPQVQLQPAKPKVQFEKAKQPLVTVEQLKPKVTFQRVQQQGQTLMSMTGDDLIGRQVVAPNGGAIGEVVNIVASKQNKSINAVVDLGGTASGAAKGIVLPMQAFKLSQGKLQVGASEQAFKTPPAYNESKYQPIKLGIPIREFMKVTTK